MWWMKAKADLHYDPHTFMWTVTIGDLDDGQFGYGENFLLPVAYAKAVGEYYGYFKPKI